MNKKTLISVLNIGTKPHKALKALKVKTVGDFLSLNLDRVFDIPGMGKGTFKRLILIRRRIQNLLNQQSGSSNSYDWDWDTVFNQFSVRTQKGLTELGIDSLNKFIALTEDRFLATHAIGAVCWKEVCDQQKLIHSVES